MSSDGFLWLFFRVGRRIIVLTWEIVLSWPVALKSVKKCWTLCFCRTFVLDLFKWFFFLPWKITIKPPFGKTCFTFFQASWASPSCSFALALQDKSVLASVSSSQLVRNWFTRILQLFHGFLQDANISHPTYLNRRIIFQAIPIWRGYVNTQKTSVILHCLRGVLCPNSVTWSWHHPVTIGWATNLYIWKLEASNLPIWWGNMMVWGYILINTTLFFCLEMFASHCCWGVVIIVMEKWWCHWGKGTRAHGSQLWRKLEHPRVF